MTATFDSTINAYVNESGFAFYDFEPATLKRLSRGFTIETDDGIFVSFSGAYAYYIAYACHNGTSFNVAAAGEIANQLLGFKRARYSSTTLRDMTPIIQPKPGTGVGLTFTKLYYTPGGLGDGFIHNYGGKSGKGKTYGFLSQLLVDPEYQPVITKMSAIVNSWPNNPKAVPAIQRAVRWANERRTTFANPDMVRRYVFIKGSKITTSDYAPSERKSINAVEYPYIRVSAGQKGYLTLPFWCPQHRNSDGDTFPALPFVSFSGQKTLINNGDTFTELTHFKDGYPFVELSDLDEASFNYFTSLIGYIRYPEMVTEITRRGGVSHGSVSLGNNIGTVIADGFKIKDEGEITWSHNAEERRRTLESISEDSYRSKGMYSSCAPECIVGFSQWAMLYGMCAAVGEWKRGLPLENLFLCGPRIGFFAEEPLVYNARIMKFDAGQTFI